MAGQKSRLHLAQPDFLQRLPITFAALRITVFFRHQRGDVADPISRHVGRHAVQHRPRRPADHEKPKLPPLHELLHQHRAIQRERRRHRRPILRLAGIGAEQRHAFAEIRRVGFYDDAPPGVPREIPRRLRLVVVTRPAGCAQSRRRQHELRHRFVLHQ